MKHFQNKLLCSVLTATLGTMFLLTACAANSSGAMPGAMSSAAVNYSVVKDASPAAVAEEWDMETAADMAGSETDMAALSSERKIVKNATVNMETMEYDEAYQIVSGITEELGGYIESSSIDGISLYNKKSQYQSNRYASFTVRIPAEQLTAYIDALSEEFNITNKSESASDISDQYYDTQARLENLEIQEKRLLELLEQAGELSDLLDIERELADVRYEIETLTASIKRMDSKVAYSTVNIYLEEVIEYQERTVAPRTFGERLKDALKGSGENFLDVCEDALFAFIYAAPMLLVLAAVVVLIILVVRAISKRNKKNPPALPNGWQKPEEPQENTKSDENP